MVQAPASNKVHKLYRPKGLVRARQLKEGYWEVFDGPRTIILEDGVFKSKYQIAAQKQWLNKETGDYEYHTD